MPIKGIGNVEKANRQTETETEREGERDRDSERETERLIWCASLVRGTDREVQLPQVHLQGTGVSVDF